MTTPYIFEKIEEAIAKNDRDLGEEILFVDEFDIDWDKWEGQTQLYSLWYDRWLCTDTHVGGKIMFFDSTPFALVYQSARKAQTVTVIFDKLIAEQVKRFMQTMLQPLEESNDYEVVDMMHFTEDDLKKLVFGVDM